MSKIFTLVCALIFWMTSCIASTPLQRDNIKQSEHWPYFCKDCMKYFDYFGKKKYFYDLELYIKYIPSAKGKLCDKCLTFKSIKIDGIYAPYFATTDFFDMLVDHTFYSANNKCECFWPEVSENAAIISNLSFTLFSDLLKTTPLKILLEQKAQKEFLITKPINATTFSLQGFLAVLLSKSFFYSHYARVCEHLEEYSISHFDEDDCLIIQQKLEELKESLSEQFLMLYKKCHKKHRNKRILLESELILNEKISDGMENFDCPKQFKLKELEGKTNCISFEEVFIAEKELFNFVSDGNYQNEFKASTSEATEKNNHIHWLESKLLTQKGFILNNFFLYKDSIQTLTEAIKLNPSNKEAYIERALAYFETDKLSLALKDYDIVKKLTDLPPFYPAPISLYNDLVSQSLYMGYTHEEKVNFSKGLLLGTLKGLKVGGKEFIPGVWNSCRGILNGLWAFTCSPIEVSKELSNSAYALGEYISNNSSLECLKCVVPELRELSITWNKIDDYSKGEKIGFIIGKYGIDIFLPVGALKGVSKLKKLKRANTLSTLESCTSSTVKRAKILEESEKLANCRQRALAENLKKSKILIKCPNAQHHVMQNKHAWEMLIELTGDVTVDFQKTIALLEEVNILNISCLAKKPKFFPKISPKIKKSEYEKIVSGWKIHAEFETYLETGEIFLKDAWVITK